MRTAHTAISDGSMLFPLEGKDFLVSDHDNIAGAMFCGTLCASVVVPPSEHTVWAVTQKGEENLFGLLARNGESLEGCVVGSGVGGILPILGADREWIGSFIEKVHERGGEAIIEIPPTISPSTYRKIADIAPERHVPSLFYHGGGPAHLILRPSRHHTTRFLLLQHPLDGVLRKNSEKWTERLQYSASISFPQISDDDMRYFYERYGHYEEINLYGKWLPIVVIATRFIEALRAAGVVCNLRGSGGASCILRSAFGFPPPENGLSIERFISPHRSSPPDIDIDVEDRARAVAILDNVCNEMGMKCYRFAVYSSSPQGIRASAAPAGCLIVPREFPVPLLSDQPQDGLPPVTQIPSSLADSMPVCKIDVLQVDSLALISYLGLDVSLGYQLREVPAPRTEVGIPHLQTELGKKILQSVREHRDTLSLKDIATMVCLERPGLVRFISYLLKRHFGINPPKGMFVDAKPKGQVFLYQEAMIKYVAAKRGAEVAEKFRKAIKSRTPSKWLLQTAEELGIELSACRYLYNLSHARAYAAIVLLFSHAMDKYPDAYFRFFYNRASSEEEKRYIAQEAAKYNVSL